MQKVLLVIYLCVSYGRVEAQNWQTVCVRDTNFYSAGNVFNGHLMDSSSLRTMWVDSAKAVASDSLFYFFRTIRIDTPLLTKCQDTAAPSWLGPFMIRKTDGTEYYFNSRGDTVCFKTKAGLGETWILGKDAIGRIFMGNITTLALQTVDGVYDSVKTISIQAMSGGIPAPDPYNSRIFQLSKEHGWLKTMDLYRFPDSLNQSAYSYGLLPDPFEHLRLPKKIAIWKAGKIDLSWRYAPGNDYITTYNYGVAGSDAPSLGGNEIVTEDSVLAFTQVSTVKASVTFRTIRFSHLWIYRLGSSPNGFVNTMFTEVSIHTDSIVDPGGKEVRSFPVYDSKNGPLPYGVNSGFFYHYCTDSMSNGKFTFEEDWAAPSGALIQQDSCWKWHGTSPDHEATTTNWVEDFGERLLFYYYASPTPTKYQRTEVTYANLPGLKWGQKINVSKLGVSEETSIDKPFGIYPNPVAEVLTISSKLHGQHVQATLRNISGQILYQLSSSEAMIRIPVASIPEGLYFLQISGAGIRQSFKVIIRH